MSVTPLTAQQVFDRVWNHFIVNRKPRSIQVVSDSGGSSCRYRDNRGNACAFGLFIPDALYNCEAMEGQAIFQILTNYPTIAKQFTSSVLENLNGHHYNLLEALQECHDDYPDFDDMKQAFVGVAKDFNLTVPS